MGLRPARRWSVPSPCSIIALIWPKRKGQKMTTEIRQTVCPMDCPDACSLDVEVQDGRVAAIRAGDRNPLTGGFICTKVSRFGRRLYGPDRLLYPQRRSGPKGSGRFERISWEEAATEIASRFQSIRD